MLCLSDVWNSRAKCGQDGHLDIGYFWGRGHLEALASAHQMVYQRRPTFCPTPQKPPLAVVQRVEGVAE